MSKAKPVEISIRGAARGFAVYVDMGKHGLVNFPARNWEEASTVAQGLEFMLKLFVRDQTLIVAPLPHCSSCKSEKVWEKSLDGQWSRFCMDCDYVEHL
jgi:hypothetical protein